MTSYVTAFASIHFTMLIFAACCGEAALRTINTAEVIAQGGLSKVLGRGVDAAEDYVEERLEPLTMIMEGRERITRRNRQQVLRDNIIENYDILEMEDFAYHRPASN